MIFHSKNSFRFEQRRKAATPPAWRLLSPSFWKGISILASYVLPRSVCIYINTNPCLSGILYNTKESSEWIVTIKDITVEGGYTLSLLRLITSLTASTRGSPTTCTRAGPPSPTSSGTPTSLPSGSGTTRTWTSPQAESWIRVEIDRPSRRKNPAQPRIQSENRIRPH